MVGSQRMSTVGSQVKLFLRSCRRTKARADSRTHRAPEVAMKRIPNTIISMIVRFERFLSNISGHGSIVSSCMHVYFFFEQHVIVTELYSSWRQESSDLVD